MSERATHLNGDSAKGGRRLVSRAVSRRLSFLAATAVVTGAAVLGLSESAFAAPNIPITITPSTGLTNGVTVTVTGSGFAKNSPGNFLECNSDANQPNVALGGLINSSISVSCTAPAISALVATKADGSLNGTFKVVQGTVGPPCGPQPALVTCPATDTAGNSPTADAALYPCPPTAAQQAAGDTCTLTYGDQANDSGVGTITFQGSPPTTTATTAAAPSTTAAPAPTTTRAPVTAGSSATTSPATAAAPSPSTLATTGPGGGVGWLGVIGGTLILSGLLLLLLLNAPRRALAGLVPSDGIRRMRPRVVDAPNRFFTRRVVGATSRWAGHVDHLGRKLGDQVSGAPSAARGLAEKVASASTRTASWFLGR